MSQSGDPSVGQSGDPFVGQSGDPFVGQSGDQSDFQSVGQSGDPSGARSRGRSSARSVSQPGERSGARLNSGLACALLALAACSPYQLAAPPPDPTAVTRPFTAYLDGMATVCIIRTSPIALAVTFLVYDNDVLVGATRGPTWFCYRAEPGAHDIKIASDDGQQRFSVDLDERGRYYLDQGLTYNLGFVVPRGRWVDEPTAATLLPHSAHRVLQGAPAKEALLIGTDVAGALPPDAPPPDAPPPDAAP